MLLGFLFTPNEVCYGKYGCFKKQPGSNAVLVYLPEEPSVIRTSFHMFTRYGFGIVDDIDESKLRAPKFDISRRTIIVIHGYTGKCLLFSGCIQKENRETIFLHDRLVERVSV